MSDSELADILARHDTEEWRSEVFPIVEELLREKGVNSPFREPSSDGLPPAEAETLVAAIELPNPGLVPLAKSILKAARIRYVVTNEQTQNLLGLGQLGAGCNFITGPPAIMVEPGRLEDAQQLLNLLLQQTNEEAEPPERDQGVE